MPKVTIGGRRRLKADSPDKPYSRPTTTSTRLTRNKDENKNIFPSSAGGEDNNPSTSKGVSSIRRLEALARATTKLKLEFENAPTTNSKHCLPWVDRNFPTNLQELFVNKKKVSDIKAWMEAALGITKPSAYMRNIGKMCIFSGPTGSGKTATAYLVAKDLEVEVKEWINPMNLTQFKENRTAIPGDEVLSRSQLDIFSDFLLRSSQYSSLPIKGKKCFNQRIVIVEDFPNGFYRDTQAFHNLLRNYATAGVSPVIFIIPDTASGECNPIKLFPKQLVQDLNITQFTFNAVAMTFMTKFLNFVCNRENVSLDSTILEGVAAASSGDMRCAINTLQFKILQEKPQETVGFKKPLPKSSKIRKDNLLKNQGLTQKDSSLFLFRALGKVLYNKRDSSTKSVVESQLHENLAEHSRPFPSVEVPEDIVKNIEVSTETFVGFLHQNYPHFFGTVESCAKAASYLGDSEVLLSRWNFDDYSSGSKHYKNQDTREQLALCLAIRGLMHSNDNKVSNEWRPLRKPLCGDIHTKVQKVFDDARGIFPTQDSVIQSYYYETIPYYGKMMTGQFLTSPQKSFVRELCTYKDSKQLNKSKWLETLDEKSAVVEDSDLPTDDDDESTESTFTNAVLNTNGKSNNTVEMKSVDRNSASYDVIIEDPNDYRIDEFDDD